MVKSPDLQDKVIHGTTDTVIVCKLIFMRGIKQACFSAAAATTTAIRRFRKSRSLDKQFASTSDIDRKGDS